MFLHISYTLSTWNNIRIELQVMRPSWPLCTAKSHIICARKMPTCQQHPSLTQIHDSFSTNHNKKEPQIHRAQLSPIELTCKYGSKSQGNRAIRPTPSRHDSAAVPPTSSEPSRLTMYSPMFHCYDRFAVISFRRIRQNS
jgi:hypothetical protein